VPEGGAATRQGEGRVDGFGGRAHAIAINKAAGAISNCCCSAHKNIMKLVHGLYGRGAQGFCHEPALDGSARPDRRLEGVDGVISCPAGSSRRRFALLVGGPSPQQTSPSVGAGAKKTRAPPGSNPRLHGSI